MRNRFLWILALLCLLATGVRGQEEAPDAQPGVTPWADPESVTGALREQITTGGSYSAASGNGSRMVNDLQVPDALGTYGLDFTRYWNSLHNEETNLAARWPTDFGPSGWSHSWRWEAVYDDERSEGDPPPTVRTSTTSITVTFPDGHATKFKIARTNAGGNSYPPVGPPYNGEHETTLWPRAGIAVHDRIAEMTETGSQFWLYRADGGAVHFVGVDPPDMSRGYAEWTYEAREVYDPYGFRTDLIYEDGRLKRVEQEGGRSLILTWSGYVITKVETGGFAAGQEVNYYYYSKFHPFGSGNLAQVRYQNEPVMGQTTSAYYVYSRAFGDDPNGPLSGTPILKRADDPHFAGAMTKIRYAYRGDFCPVPSWPENNPPEHFYSRYHFTGHAISEERSGESGTTGTMVSKFYSTCAGGRSEENGIGGRRTFYFGDLANDDEVDTIFGYQLTKVTDFGLGNESRPFRKQAGGSQPGIVWDGHGIDTHFQYLDESGSPTQVVYKDGSSCLYDRTNQTPAVAPIYNKQRHWLFSKKDENGNVTTYTRDSRRRVTRIAYYQGPAEGTPVASESYTYNNLNQVETHTLPSGIVQNYEYDAQNRLAREWNLVDRAGHGPIADRVYGYDALGRVATMLEGRAATANAPFTVRMTYNGRHQVLSVESASTNGQYPTVRYEYDKYGNCTAVTNELGHRSTYTYDSYRRCTSYTEPLNAAGWNGSGTVASRTWDWVYDRVIPGVGQFFASAHTSREWRIQVEPAFSVVNNIGYRQMTARYHDVNNRITAETTGLIATSPTTGQNTPDTETHYFTYDDNGQKEKYTDPRGRETTYEYDIRNRLWKTNETVNTPLPRTTKTLYDPTGNKLSVEFPDEKMQHWENYDPFGQPGRFIDERNNPTDLTYKWGPMKKLETVKTYREMDHPGGTETQLTVFEYDQMGRPWKTIFPDQSTEETTYEFGQVSTFKTRKNQAKRLHYDARGREDYHTWDAAAAPGINRVWDAANRLTSIANVWSTIEYGYDEGGQAKWERSNVVGSNAPAQVNYFRFPSGQVSQISYPGGATVVNRFYTTRAQLKGVGWGSGSTSYAYHPDGKVDYQAFSGPGGVWTKYGYNGRGMIDWVKHRVGDDETGHDVARRDYYRDERDRILAWKRGNDQFYNSMEDGRGNRYRYDDEGQLDRASYRAVLDSQWNPSDARRSDMFTYDKLGNRMGSNYLASRGTLDFTRDNNGLNQYSGWWPYSFVRYDDDVGGIWGAPHAANGVLMEEGYFTAGFNALNQPTGIWSKTYAPTSNWMYFGYDPLGRCVKRWVAPYGAPSTNATYYYYDGWNLIQEGPSGGTAARVYVHGGRVDEIVASWGNGQWYSHHYDAQGNCIMLTDGNGLIQEQYDYDAFGLPYVYRADGTLVPLKLGSPAGNRFLFTGREWIKDHRLYDYRARMYQPELGRFLQPDPTQFEAGDYNLYRYCHNDPVNRTDPFGLEFTDRNPEFVAEIPGRKFGDTEFSVGAHVGVERGPNNTFQLRVQVFNVTVTRKQIALTANGRSRSGSAVKASVKHENRHVKFMHDLHDANQNKVIESGLTEKQANGLRSRREDRLLDHAERAAMQDQRECKVGFGAWKSIILDERR